MSDAETPEETGEVKKKGPALVGMLLGGLVPVVMGGAAAGLAFFLSPAPTTCAAPAKAEDGAEDAKAGEADDAHGATESGHGEKKAKQSSGHGDKGKNEFVFVPMDPLVVTLGPEAEAKYLKITINLETEKGNEADVAGLMPKLRDVLNGYLRALDEADLAEPSNMSRIRAQMLRRLQLVAPDAGISNVLITDFVLT